MLWSARLRASMVRRRMIEEMDSYASNIDTICCFSGFYLVSFAARTILSSKGLAT